MRSNIKVYIGLFVNKRKTVIRIDMYHQIIAVRI